MMLFALIISKEIKINFYYLLLCHRLKFTVFYSENIWGKFKANLAYDEPHHMQPTARKTIPVPMIS